MSNILHCFFINVTALAFDYPISKQRLQFRSSLQGYSRFWTVGFAAASFCSRASLFKSLIQSFNINERCDSRWRWLRGQFRAMVLLSSNSRVKTNLSIFLRMLLAIQRFIFVVGSDIQRIKWIYIFVLAIVFCLRAFGQFETIQRRLAWPLH